MRAPMAEEPPATPARAAIERLLYLTPAEKDALRRWMAEELILDWILSRDVQGQPLPEPNPRPTAWFVGP